MVFHAPPAFAKYVDDSKKNEDLIKRIVAVEVRAAMLRGHYMRRQVQAIKEDEYCMKRTVAVISLLSHDAVRLSCSVHFHPTLRRLLPYCGIYSMILHRMLVCSQCHSDTPLLHFS